MNQFTSLVWDAHGIGFEIPNNFVSTVNNVNEFAAGNGNVDMHIAVWEDGYVTEADLANQMETYAYNIGFNRIDIAQPLQLTDFIGFGVFGHKDGMPTAAMMLLDMHSSTNFICTVVCPGGNIAVAERIMGSFYAYDGDSGTAAGGGYYGNSYGNSYDNNYGY